MESYNWNGNGIGTSDNANAAQGPQSSTGMVLLSQFNVDTQDAVAWNPCAVNITGAWSLTFVVNFGCQIWNYPNCWGGDGMAFILQADSNNGNQPWTIGEPTTVVGTNGEHAYDAIPNSLAIDFDVFTGGQGSGIIALPNPNSCVNILVNGQSEITGATANSAVTGCTANPPPVTGITGSCFPNMLAGGATAADCNNHTVVISWNPTDTGNVATDAGTLTVSVDGNPSGAWNLPAGYINSIFNTDQNVIYGFGASNGGASNNQEFEQTASTGITTACAGFNPPTGSIPTEIPETPILCGATVTESDTVTPAPSFTATFTVTDTPTRTFTATSTGTATQTSTPTSSDTYTATKSATPTDTPSGTPTSTFTDSSTKTSTRTATATPTASSTVTVTETATELPTGSPTESSTATPTDTSSKTPTSTFTDSPTETSTKSPTATSTASPTVTVTETATDLPTGSATETSTAMPTPTRSATPTDTVSATPTDTVTASPTDSSSASATPTGTPSSTSTFTASPVDSATDTKTHTPSFTPSNSDTATPTVTESSTYTSTSTATASRTSTSTRTATLSLTPTATWSATSTATATPSLTQTFTPSVTPLPEPYLVTVDIYNSAGELVRGLYNGPSEFPADQAQVLQSAVQSGGVQVDITGLDGGAGSKLVWAGTNNGGQEVSGGIYTVQISSVDAFGQVQTRDTTVSVVDTGGAVSLWVFNSAGELVADLSSGVSNLGSQPIAMSLPAGQRGVVASTNPAKGGLNVTLTLTDGQTTTVFWNGLGSQGQALQSGNYLLTLYQTVAGSNEILKTLPVAVVGSSDASANAVAQSALVVPDPVAGNSFEVQYQNNGTQTAVGLLYDLTGQRVGEATDAGSGTLSFSGAWSPGIYLLDFEVRNGTGVQARRELKVAVVR